MAQTKAQRSAAAKKAARTRKRNQESGQRTTADRSLEPAATTAEEEQELVQDIEEPVKHPKESDGKKATKGTHFDPAAAAPRPEPTEETIERGEARKRVGGEAQVAKFENNNPEYGGDAEHPAAGEAAVDAARAGATDARNIRGEIIQRTTRRERGKVRKPDARKDTQEIKDERARARGESP